MENRITKILDKMEKSYKIDEEGCITVKFTVINKVIGVTIKFIEFMDIKIVDEELGLVEVRETVKDDARDEIIKRQIRWTTIDNIIITLLDSCICELDNE